MKYNITIYSTALFSTWINIEELNLLVDAGDGITSGLLQKSRKIKNVFITHPDRDHLNGLPQFIQLNSREGYPIIHYPKDSGSFPAMRNFLTNFDAHARGSTWIGIEDRQRISIRSDYEIEAIRNEHIDAPKGIHESLSYKLFHLKNKLKSQFSNLKTDEIKNIVSREGRDFITERVEKNVISFSGDTPVDDYSKWDQSGILIHESTFIEGAGVLDSPHKNKHATVEEVMKMVSEIEIKGLILIHFSARYSKEQIDSSVRSLINKFGIKIPVYIVYPGEIKRDILSTAPINA